MDKTIKMRICAIAFACSAIIVKAQIDYVQHPDIISNFNREVRINWINSSPKKCVIDFNQFVEFHNVNSDIITGSTVKVVLYKNDAPIQTYLFATGGGIYNRIYVAKPIPLKRGDALYFIFTLQPESESEEYVFNIFQRTREAPVPNTINNVQPLTASSLSKRETQQRERIFSAQELMEKNQREQKQKYSGPLKREMRKKRWNSTIYEILTILF